MTQIMEISKRIDEMKAEGTFPALAHVQREYWGLCGGGELRHITITLHHISDLEELITLIPKDWTIKEYEHTVYYWSNDQRKGVTFRF